MDSGNSGGSLQSSSSGGDGGGGGGVEVNPPTHFNPLPILQPSSSFFDSSSFSQPINPNPNSMYNLDSLWSRTSNSDPIYNQDPYRNPNPVDNGHEKLGVRPKNPKKRTRASRRAPTTVLTTDTTNFRQMVQEFTGIPAAPFSASSSAISRRIDLYGGGASPVNHLRPSFLNSAAATTSDFHITPSGTHEFTKQPLNLTNLTNLTNLSNLSSFQNQMFPFQSVSQTNLHQQVNATERENQRSELANVFPSSSSTSLKRWRGQDENLVNFKGVNGNSQDAVVSSRSVGDQLPPGNEDSWSFD